ncbi:peptide ABC transporter substrate-binding protein [Ferruginivarius sediminum]|uniref:Peptide ABC transporter substrate-binding protein n=1 Tax=Ferruginivarius sediminum TaxID=2661937 RepID=A0A369TF35_9PROT|nr:peptide ABC transporter substrate-binding protein [Ferruginivarius sediminum]RDD63933.1 peptide ABC transporter substrate-binding protein [Ferruginivarius sediminum]
MPRLLATLAAALFCALATPASAERGTAGGAGTLTIGITQFPATFHPTIDAMLAKSYMLALGRRPITAYDPDWRQICMLCSKLPTIENGLAEKEELPDGSEGIAVTYSLHPDATWGDGEPVTSEDVRFTWEVGKHPKSGVAAGEIYRRIREIEIHDEHTFTVHVDRVTFDYNDFALSILPAHLEREVFEADPAQYRNRTTFDAEPTNPGLYFGPYRMVEVTQGARAVFEPNPTWYGPAPAFDRIVVRVIENTAALEANLLSGSIDMIAGELGLNIDQALALEKRHGERYEFIYQPGLVYEHIDFNLDNPILADRKVRHALAYAADRQAITEQLFQGKQQVAHSSVSPLDTVHTEDVPKYPYKPDKAAKLLDEAGWNRMKGGIRHNAKGEPLRLRLMTTAGNRTRELVQQVLQSQWRQAGIDVRIKNEPARVFFGETVTKRKYGGMAMYAWLSSPESVPRSSLHSDMIPSEENAWSGQNIPGFANERMDALIDRTERELDPEKRKKLWAEIQQLYARELPVLPLFWRAQPFVLPTWLTGLEPTGHQFPTTLWVEEWGRKAGG